VLCNTFCHLPGIGPKKEHELWAAGITSWQAALEQPGPAATLRRSCGAHLHDSLRQYEARNPAYFSALLPSAQQWRYFTDFRSSCAYVDIETTGMTQGVDQITTICLYDGQSVRTYIRGENLDDFPRDIAAYQVLVTYNGRCFDVPFLERGFRIALEHAHIDLRYVLRNLGISGGLKRCEQQCGLARPGMEEMDGFLAVLLWREYQRRQNREALQSLLAYNVQDTVNLEALLVWAYNRHIQATPFVDSHHLPSPALPHNPFVVDADLVQRFARANHWAPYTR
jgi:uncharacterized protein YprB with RNaseH-like and TPR domain